mgnify:CR=1 FL=1
MFEEIFTQKKLIPEKLLDFGFSKEGGEGSFSHKTEILGGEFTLFLGFSLGKVESPRLHIETKLIEKATGEEYVLYKTRAAGTFVGEVREAIEAVLLDVAEKCSVQSVFAFPQTERVICHVRETYGDALEFLWEKFPDNAVFRRSDTQKWYAALLTVSRKKLGLESDEKIEIIDLRIQSDKMDELLQNPNYFPGWHMNKKHWFSVILDGSVSDEELFKRIDESYNLARK